MGIGYAAFNSQMPYGVTWKQFASDLLNKTKQDHLSIGAAALAYYLTLAIFPALILLLSLVPYIPIPNVDQAIQDFLQQSVPEQAAGLLTGIVRDVLPKEAIRFPSLATLGGTLGTLWAASNGILAIMQQLNLTHGVNEERSFLRVRLSAIGLTLLVGALMISAFSLVVLGGQIESWLDSYLGFPIATRALFALLRWIMIIGAFQLAFALLYNYGPNIRRKFQTFTPGSLFGVLMLIVSSSLFRLYVSNFGNYNATYGSIGAAIVLILWLYISGLAFILGSEVDVLVDNYRKIRRTETKTKAA